MNSDLNTWVLLVPGDFDCLWVVYLNDSVAKETKILSYEPVTIVYSYLESSTEILRLNQLVMTATGTGWAPWHDKIICHSWSQVGISNCGQNVLGGTTRRRSPHQGTHIFSGFFFFFSVILFFLTENINCNSSLDTFYIFLHAM